MGTTIIIELIKPKTFGRGFRSFVKDLYQLTLNPVEVTDRYGYSLDPDGENWATEKTHTLGIYYNRKLKHQEKYGIIAEIFNLSKKYGYFVNVSIEEDTETSSLDVFIE